MQTPEQLEHLQRARRVERAGGLVRQQQRRLVHQRAGDREPLALAAGEDAGEVVRLLAQPEQVEQAPRARLRAPARARPRSRAASTTFSSALIPSSRLKNWKTKPMCCAPHAGRARPRPCPRATRPARTTSPPLGVSTPATRFRSVDFPQPDGPITATNSPLLNSRLDAAQRTQGRRLRIRSSCEVRGRAAPRPCAELTPLRARCQPSQPGRQIALLAPPEEARCQDWPGLGRRLASPYPAQRKQAMTDTTGSGWRHAPPMLAAKEHKT